jgi:DNA-binding transcriptional ArsR family regulator
MQQLPLPIESSASRDEAYLAELDRAGLPAAAKRVARWLIEAGHPQRTAEGERLYAVAGGQFRELATRSGIPLSTFYRGLSALGAAGLVAQARGCYCLFVTELCELGTAGSDAVPQAPTDDWGQVYLPRRRSPERPAAADRGPPRPGCSSSFQSVPGSFQSVPVRSSPVPACSSSFQAGEASISARAPVVVVVKDFTNNNPPDPAGVKDLARRAWAKLHGERRRAPRPDPHQRLLLLRCAWLALASDLGDRWLIASAAARPLRGERQDPLRFFTAAAAYQAWERATGQPPEEPEERREAKRQLREMLGRVALPEELARREP